MQGGKHAVLDAELFVDDFDDGGDAVCGAGGVGDDVMLGGIVEVVITTHHDVQDALFYGSGDDHFFDTGIEISLEGFEVAECAGAFENDVDAGPVNF